MVSECSISFLLEIADDEVSRHFHDHVLEMVTLNMTLTTYKLFEICEGNICDIMHGTMCQNVSGFGCTGT